MSTPRIYCAGPMTGKPHFNFPAFYEAEAQLVDAGWLVDNPARIDIETDRVRVIEGGFEMTDKFDLARVLLDDLELIRQADAVYFLREWGESKGAQLEYAYAVALGKAMYYQHDGTVPTADEWAEDMADLPVLKVTSPSPGSSPWAPFTGIPPLAAVIREVRQAAPVESPIPPTLQAQRVATDMEYCGDQVDKSQPLDPDAYAAAVAATSRLLHTAGVAPVPVANVLHGDEVRVTSETGGQKGKKLAQLGALDPVALLELAKVAGMGAEKYATFNFLKGYDWSLSFNAALRHLLEFWDGHDIDPESGLSAAAHAAWQCLALVSFWSRQIGTDDRPPHHD